MRSTYPFSAVVGQDELKLALLLSAVDPSIGGVLIKGERGTAKTTIARGLAALLPPTAAGGPAPFVELPLGATEDRVVGSLDVTQALRDGDTKLRSGVLARANGGVLYVDEVNLLPDHLVDLLLDAAASGWVTVERDGVSAGEAARFVLIGTMNPEEGGLRPQFLDRFGLSVHVRGLETLELRMAAVSRRLEFDADPTAVISASRVAEDAIRQSILDARERLTSLPVTGAHLSAVSAICTEQVLDGIRGDLAIIKTARALAAWEKTSEITSAHIHRAAALALPHRMRRRPQPAADRSITNRARPPLRPPPRNEAAGTTEFGGERGATGAARGGGPEALATGIGSGVAPEALATGTGRGGGPEALATGIGSGVAPEALATGTGRGDGPEALAAQADAGAVLGGSTLSNGRQTDTGDGISVAPATSINLVTDAIDREAAGRRGTSSVASRRATRATRYDQTGTLAINETLIAAATRGMRVGERGIAVAPADLMQHTRSGPGRAHVLFLVDASASMATQRRLDLAKNAALGLLQSNYQKRDEVALMVFRGERTQVVVPFTRDVAGVEEVLSSVPTGGRTPLARALRDATEELQSRNPALLVLFTDGRANVSDNGGDPWQESLAACEALKHASAGALVVDCETGPIVLGRAKQLATQLGADCIALNALQSNDLTLHISQRIEAFT